MQLNISPSSFETPAARDAALALLRLSVLEPAAVKELVRLCDGVPVPEECLPLLQKRELVDEDGSVPRSVRYVVSESQPERQRLA